MSRSKVVGWTVVLLACLSAVGCISLGHNVDLECRAIRHNGRVDGGLCTVSGQLKALVPGEVISFAGYDASRAYIDLSQSTAFPKQDTMAFNLLLRRSGAIVASTSVSAKVIGSEVRFVNPAAVNLWLQQHNNMGDALDGEVSPEFYSNIGTNVATFEIKYDNVVVDAATYSWYRSGPNGCEDCQLK